MRLAVADGVDPLQFNYFTRIQTWLLATTRNIPIPDA